MTTLPTPSLQRCSNCDTEWFFVHNCPTTFSHTAKTLEGSAKDIKRIGNLYVRDLLSHVEELEHLVKEQQNTITQLMLELADLRIAAEMHS